MIAARGCRRPSAPSSFLADGAVEDCAVECPAHAARFDLRTGAGTPPARGSVAVHAVRVDGDDVLVALPASYTVDDTGR